ncbi:tribbles homolog 2-like [Diadema antillarum]|uniref:tribbles homolog 2-like n=1 Tax=Diadema antillarum TaxID=105358 RepID=UPI003A8752C7
MNLSPTAPIPIHHGRSKVQIFQDSSSNLNSSSGALSPQPQLSPSPPDFIPQEEHVISRIGNHVLLEEVGPKVFKSINTFNHHECICKVTQIQQYRETFAPTFQLGPHPHISNVEEVLLGETQAYVMFPATYGDMHTFVRRKRKLREREAAPLFRQMVEAVAHCHAHGVVLRDLKLRKFVFKNEERTEVVLEGVEDAHILESPDNDSLSDKHGCPAYVSPEILLTNGSYSGKAADVWSLGVILYTMLVGRYPFHDSDPAALFTKIRLGQYQLPDSMSTQAKSVIHSLMRVDPSERLTAEEILQHPWFRNASLPHRSSRRADSKIPDQLVPDFFIAEEGIA